MTTVSPPDASVSPGLPARLAARAIDMALLVGLEVGLGRWLGFGFDWLILGAVLVLVYFVALDAMAGATLGKLALGLRVVGPDGGRPTLRQAALREAFTVFGAVPFVGPLLALGAWVGIAWTIRKSPTGQGPHDQFAGGTRVVRAR